MRSCRSLRSRRPTRSGWPYSERSKTCGGVAWFFKTRRRLPALRIPASSWPRAASRALDFDRIRLDQAQIARIDREGPTEGESFGSVRQWRRGRVAAERTFSGADHGQALALRSSSRRRPRPTARSASGNRRNAPRCTVRPLRNGSRDEQCCAIPRGWSEPYILKIQDVPASGLSPLRVRFDLVGAGEVWIDDIQLWHLQFEESERRRLDKVLELPAFQLEKGKLGDCLRELESYWPRFVATNVPLSSPIAGTTQQDPDNSADKRHRARA